MPNYQFEVCANSVESCLAAREGGAHRVELCAGIPEGGTTPSYGEIRQALRLLHREAQPASPLLPGEVQPASPLLRGGGVRGGGDTLPRLHVIIRPRGGDFLYSDLELDRMADDIRLCRELGVDGVVFGCLRPDGSLHTEANARLLEVALDEGRKMKDEGSSLFPHPSSFSITFHRAFDRCAHPHEALEELIAQGFHRVLTSGQQPTAELGIPLLKSLHEQADGRIGIMAGCGVNEQNIRRIALSTGITEFHFSAREPFRSQMQYANPAVYMGAKGADEDTLLRTTAQRVRATIAQIKGLCQNEYNVWRDAANSPLLWGGGVRGGGGK